MIPPETTYFDNGLLIVEHTEIPRLGLGTLGGDEEYFAIAAPYGYRKRQGLRSAFPGLRGVLVLDVFRHLLLQ